MWWNNGMDWGGMGGGGWVVMTVLMLAFWALVVGGVVAGLGWLVVRRPLTAVVELLARTRLRRVLTAA